MFHRTLFINKIPTRLMDLFIVLVIESVVILFLDHPIKYALYIFALSLTGLLFLIAFRYDCKFKLKLANLLSFKIIDYFFIICSVAVLASTIFSTSIVIINFVLSVIVSF